MTEQRYMNKFSDEQWIDGPKKVNRNNKKKFKIKHKQNAISLSNELWIDGPKAKEQQQIFDVEDDELANDFQFEKNKRIEKWIKHTESMIYCQDNKQMTTNKCKGTTATSCNCCVNKPPKILNNLPEMQDVSCQTETSDSAQENQNWLTINTKEDNEFDDDDHLYKILFNNEIDFNNREVMSECCEDENNLCQVKNYQII